MLLPKVLAFIALKLNLFYCRTASTQEKLFLRSTVSEFRKSGLEEATVGQIIHHHSTLAKLDGLPPITVKSVIKVNSW